MCDIDNEQRYVSNPFDSLKQRCGRVAKGNLPRTFLFGPRVPVTFNQEGGRIRVMWKTSFAPQDWLRRRGFTLLELLVVVAIIGILAVLLLPALSKAKAQAQSTVCKNHMRQMGQALQMYVHENGSKYPYYLGPAGPSYGDAVGLEGRAVGLVYWSSKLFPYYAVNWTNSGWHCPGYKGITTGEIKGAADRLGSYAYNLAGAMAEDKGYPKHFGLGPVLYWHGDASVFEGQVKVPAEMLSVGESRFGGAGNKALGGHDNMQCGSLPEFALRHGNNFNQLFCDGHVQAMNPWILFNPTNSAVMWNYDHEPHPEMW